jgi:hypothetical protein
MPEKFGTTFTPLSNDLVALDIFGQWMGDLRKTWDVIAVAIGIAVLAGYNYMNAILVLICKLD